MYWCKIATTNQEFEEISKLNYTTFVEEIPQHPKNEHKRLVDQFHHENTYIIVYKDEEIVGMLALRDQRPFSLDQKIGAVEQTLPTRHCKKLCEVRLLAVKKAYRNGRVFIRLTQALVSYLFERNYTACVISGTTREEKLYSQMGFQQFAPVVGTKEAQFLPMILTREASKPLRDRLARQKFIFYPGPVEQVEPLQHTNVSHRSLSFQMYYEELTSQLQILSQANYVVTLVGSGTLANDAMLAQLKFDFPTSKGLILTNGEFGERLVKQAVQQRLAFDTLHFAWHDSISLEHVEGRVREADYKWLLYVHGETSTGVCNGNQLVDLAFRYRLKLCADCISSFGAYPFSLASFYLATAVSGKALGALGGLAFVFSQEKLRINDAPYYLNLGYYHEKQIPFTLPASLVVNVLTALSHYPKRYALLTRRWERLKETSFYQKYAFKKSPYPMVASIQLPRQLAYLSRDLKLNGVYVYDESTYLHKRCLVQLSIIQPRFEMALERLLEIYRHYDKVMESSAETLD